MLPLRHPLQLALLACGLAAAPAAFAQVVSITRSPATVHFDARAQARVQPDTLQADFSAQKSGADVATLNDQVSSLIDSAEKTARAAGVSVHTTGFTTYPHYTNDHGSMHVDGWTVHAGLQIESTDAKKLSRVATRLGKTLQIDGIGARISAKQRERVENALTQQAIAEFQAKAGAIAKAFGSPSYTLGAITISDGNTPWQPRPVMFAAMAQERAAAPVPVAPGKQRVWVDVSGSVQLDH